MPVLEESELDKTVLLNALMAVKRGEFETRLPNNWTGLDGKIADAFNAMVELNAGLKTQLETVSRAVGGEGKTGHRITLAGADGGWASCVSCVNDLVDDLVWPTSEIARVIGGVARGDLTQTMELEVQGRVLKGEFLRTARTVNIMVEQLNGFASEVTRVAREVGTEGKLGGQARVKGLSGTWKDLSASVNLMAANLTDQVRNIAAVTTAVALGDLSKKITVDVRGELHQLKDTINTMVDQLRSFTSEVTRVAREVGTEGKLGGQALVPGSAGVWADLTDSVNLMASNLTDQVRNIAEVTTAVARGDLSRKITVDVKGEILQLKDTINTMVDQLNAFGSEVTRVAREVGTEGKLGGQAVVPGVAGVWKDLTDNVNGMATNLTDQVRNIAAVTTAVAQGDLSEKIMVDVRGELLQLKDTINTMVDQLRSFASEVTRVAREVGTEGKLGGQALVPGVAGVWKDLTDNVNGMGSNLTDQVRSIAEVTVAVARGDLSRKINVDAKGEILELKETINTMVDQLNSFGSEVTRVAREVGTEGKLGGQATVPGVAGVWKDLTDNVNLMASNLTGQVRNVAEVTTAVAEGDLSKKITVDVRGEFLQLKDTINTMVDQLRSFGSEVTRVAREVGTEGKLGGQAVVPGIAGVWKDLTDNVNLMASNLTGQVRNIAEVTTAVARGDLSRTITVDVKGEILELKNTINIMVEQLNGFASEVTRVAREVGTEGKLGGQAGVTGVAGVWKDLTDNVNLMASNLTGQVRNIAAVTTAVAGGDLSKKITVDVRGEIAELKETINIMVDQLNGFAAEVTRVAREVGTEGKLGGQADVKGVSGVWKDLTDNVNAMADNLTGQVRNIAEVTTAVANGDFSRKITVEVRGEIAELKGTMNTMVDQLQGFAAEVTRVAREVGTEGRLGGQAEVRGVSGVWKDLTDSVNRMATNLTDQVRNIADVTTAVANGDLSKKITVDVKGEILELKITINTMVEQLQGFAAEVTRVAREVGTEGKLGGQAGVPGVGGVWKDLTDSVNRMAANLTDQVRNIADVTTAVATGDLSRKITVDVRGEFLQLKDTMNTMVDQLRAFAAEVTRVAREVGTEGRLGGQAQVPGVAGTWKDLTDSVNFMASNLTSQVRNIAAVTTAVAYGDLSKKITVDVKGEILELKNTINTMVDQLNGFASEVTRVAREVGTEGKLGGQAKVTGVAGTWQDLTNNVNLMAANLTDQVRGIAKVVTAVANGNLRQRMTFQAKGEIAELADTINSMTDTLATFGDQVTTVAREVGVDGRLGGQALVPGAAGTWKDLVDNVNQLAANLTTQVRSIAEVVTAVTKGDLTRSIQVEALGEVSALKDLINEMIRNLRETTHRNAEQDWLKTNLARFTRILQGERDLVRVARSLLSELAPVVSAQHAVFYVRTGETETYKLLTSYGFMERKNISTEWAVGEGLIGTCAFEKQRILLTNVPENYVQITSGLGQGTPLNIIVLPILFEGEVKAVMELASFKLFTPIDQQFLEQLTEGIGIVLNTIEASSRTEELLKQSQALAQELKSGQFELRQTNEELEEKASLLATQNAEVERKNQEIEETRRAIEEKAEQLALTSKYKSEFLANMSHELRTPLNSLLLLAEQLVANYDGNLTGKQQDMARTIRGAGQDLLTLINDILDLSKIESGTVVIDPEEVTVHTLTQHLESTFRHVAESRNLELVLSRSEDLPATLTTDGPRLLQVLKNLLANSFKFTDKGRVSVHFYRAGQDWSSDAELVKRSGEVIAVSVTDTGIGIAPERQKVIFEAFQQADASTSRKYGGAGLGLAISRELAVLLGGELQLTESSARGSTFTVFVPRIFSGFVPISARALPVEVPAPTLFAPRALNPGDRLILIVEDNAEFSEVLQETARELHFKAVISRSAEEAVVMARELQPDAVSLDIYLPDADGWTVLDRLKADPKTRHIPVIIISGQDERLRGLQRGALAHLIKPIGREQLRQCFQRLADFLKMRVRRVLVCEDQPVERENITQMLSKGDVEVVAVESGAAALEALQSQPFECMVLDLKLPDISGFEVLQELQTQENLKNIPVIVYTGRELNKKEATRLKKLAQSVVVKGGDSMNQLVQEASVYLHKLPAEVTQHPVLQSDAPLENKRILIVDDDARNLFALTSVLERHQMVVLTAESGIEAIEILKTDRDVDLVLMDIMLPEMDGYETMTELRKVPDLQSLPIIALTAKAMKGDRERCMDAGASDYIAKPVQTDHLRTMLRIWLVR
ncbi:hybrid sensor histidine kinase/response regulator [bacterium SCN 62-11]|nr:MAG: hybrid sensor histidine kinase/response regulator [bacterium SCN 62-11]